MHIDQSFRWIQIAALIILCGLVGCRGTDEKKSDAGNDKSAAMIHDRSGDQKTSVGDGVPAIPPRPDEPLRKATIPPEPLPVPKAPDSIAFGGGQTAPAKNKGETQGQFDRLAAPTGLANAMKRPRPTVEPIVDPSPVREAAPPDPASLLNKPAENRTPPNPVGQPGQFEIAESATDESAAADDGDRAAAATMAESRDGMETKMQVFYATDRVSQTPMGEGQLSKVFFTTFLTAAISGLLFALAFFTNRKAMLLGLAAVALILCAKFGYSANLQWQKQVRLATSGNAIYTSVMNDATVGDQLEYGTCEVNIPPDHRIGTLESPSIIKLEFREDSKKHVILESVLRSDKEQFFADLNQCLDDTQLVRRQAFVFVHGYNVGFEDAVKRTAQIAFDLKFNGAPICYSWTSHGGIESYIQDMANADSTVIRLERFLKDVVSRTNSTTIHLVAHSMGNRALLQALDRIAVSQPDAEPMFGQLVMAAPDVSSRDFRNRYANAIRTVTRQATLYASSSDRALIASTSVHGHNRAGLAGKNIVVVQGIDTIDVSGVDTSLIGHSYYGENPKLIDDMRALVELAEPASHRSWLARVLQPNGSAFYTFR